MSLTKNTQIIAAKITIEQYYVPIYWTSSLIKNRKLSMSIEKIDKSALSTFKYVSKNYLQEFTYDQKLNFLSALLPVMRD